MSNIRWQQLTEMDQLNKIHEDSQNDHILIFKYSSRCSISDMALSRLARSWEVDEMENVKPYFLDLITFRNISDQIADRYQVRHESPQVLVIKNQKLHYHSSHMGINYQQLKQIVK